MSQNESDVRGVAELLMNQSRVTGYRAGAVAAASGPTGHQPTVDITRGHSINLITEEFLAGYTNDGRMSVVRRFFCLFVTFDLFFVSLLWLICIMINGDNIFQALQKQIVFYSVHTSLFDVAAIALCRFSVLLFFYAFLAINHWFVIALSTSGSCLFLIGKVFVFNWLLSNQHVFEVILIITSFILAWGEAWFLDCRVIPQEHLARGYFSDVISSDRPPLIAPLLASQGMDDVPGSVANFYSPFDSNPNSDDECEEDDEYLRMGLDCVQKTYDLLKSSNWKVEKVTPQGDTIRSTQREKLGKIYRLTGRVKYPAKALLEELFYRIEFVPRWNPAVLESKIVHKVNSFTDITYQATAGACAGIVKSRDFVNLRSWRLFRNGQIVQDPDMDGGQKAAVEDESNCSYSRDGSVSTISGDDWKTVRGLENAPCIHHSNSSIMQFSPERTLETSTFQTLSKSLGAKDFSTAIPLENEVPPPIEESFEDAKDHLDEDQVHDVQCGDMDKHKVSYGEQDDVVWISAAISIDYARVPPTTKYIRGQNLVSGFALREIEGKADACIFECLLCLDLKGYIPRYVLDAAYTSFMTDYMTYIRKYVKEMRQKRKRVPRK